MLGGVGRVIRKDGPYPIYFACIGPCALVAYQRTGEFETSIRAIVTLNG